MKSLKTINFKDESDKFMVVLTKSDNRQTCLPGQRSQ